MLTDRLAAHVAAYHVTAYDLWGLIENSWAPVFGEGSNRVLKSDTARLMYSISGIHDAELGVVNRPEALASDDARSGPAKAWCSRIGCGTDIDRNGRKLLLRLL